MIPKICDVGPRDGLQNEKTVLAPEVRIELVDRLAACGVPAIEAASFVNPKLVPAMAGAEEVMGGISRRPGTTYAGLVLNERGYDRAREAGVDEVRFSFSVTDEFGLENQNQTSAQGLDVARTLIARARADGLPIGVTLSVSFGCPFSGAVDSRRVIALVEDLMAEPPDDISLADTIGVAVPTQVAELTAAVKAAGAAVGGHFHDTRGTGIANAVAALDAGAEILDASVGGIGGCPFAPQATGNIATEDLLYTLHGMGIETGIDLDAMIETSHWLAASLGVEHLPSAVSRAGNFSPTPGTAG